MKLRNVDGRLETDLAKGLPILEIPQNSLPALACGQQVSPTPRPTQGRNALRMTPELASDTHSVEVPYDDGAINAARGEVVTFAIEAQTCRMAGSDRIGNVFGVVLEEIVV